MTVSLPPVEELIIKVKEGDPLACRQLYDRYSRAMYNTAVRITGNQADAEDVLQDSFTAAFMDLASFAQRSSFGAWLRQIVVFKSIGVLKKKRIHFAELDDQADDATEDEVIDEKEIQFAVERIKVAMATLPDGYRVILSMHLLEGFDYDEIAEILALSPSTIRTQFMRGKQKLLQTLKQYRES